MTSHLGNELTKMDREVDRGGSRESTNEQSANDDNKESRQFNRSESTSKLLFFFSTRVARSAASERRLERPPVAA